MSHRFPPIVPPERESGVQMLKRLRATCQATQPQFSELIGISTRTLAQWESGRQDVPKPVLLLLGEMLERPDKWKAKIWRGPPSEVLETPAGSPCQTSVIPVL